MGDVASELKSRDSAAETVETCAASVGDVDTAVAVELIGEEGGD